MDKTTTLFRAFLAVVAIATTTFFARAQAFEEEYNFDNGTLPEGFSIDNRIKLNNSEYFGVSPKSGDYMLGMAEGVAGATIYTPLINIAGGEIYTLEFSMMASGGNPASAFNIGLQIGAGAVQDGAQHELIGTVEKKVYDRWTNFKFDFTPQESGEYCFAIEVDPSQTFRSCGPVYIDDIFVSGVKAAPAALPSLILTPAKIEETVTVSTEPWSKTVNIKGADLVGDVNFFSADPDVRVTPARLTAEEVMSADGANFTVTTSVERPGTLQSQIQLFTDGLANDVILDINLTIGEPTPALEPDEENLADCIDLPYFETFSQASHYDGMNYLPIGWYNVGTNIWRTAAVDALPAQAGEYYMITPNSTTPRDEIAYTPFFNLTAGTEYTMSFYTYIQGNNWNEDEIMYTPTFTVTVGTQQDSEFHMPLLTVSDYANPTVGWEKREVKFTPEISGPYCFSFALSGAENTGAVAVDNVQVTAPGLIARVEPNFVPVGFFDLMDSKLITFEGAPVPFGNTTLYGVSYEWEVPGAEPETSTLTDPSFLFPSTGDYTVTLKATNPRGTRSTSKTVHVKVAGDDPTATYALQHYNESADKLLDRGKIPAFDTADDGMDAITGFNHYYLKFAQRYDLPEGCNLDLHTLSIWVTERMYSEYPKYPGHDYDRPMSVKIYGADENGDLDPAKVYGSLDASIGEIVGAVGMGGYHGEGVSIQFPNLIFVDGPIYVAMEFSDKMTIDAVDENGGRSYFSTACIKYAANRTTLYAQPYAVPEGAEAKADGKWYSLDKIEQNMKNYGAHWQIWLTPHNSTDIVAINPDGTTAFAAMFDGSTLHVSGTTAGEPVTVTDINGRTVLTATATDQSTAIEAGALQQGIYLVTTPAATAKILKN